MAYDKAFVQDAVKRNFRATGIYPPSASPIAGQLHWAAAEVQRAPPPDADQALAEKAPPRDDGSFCGAKCNAVLVYVLLLQLLILERSFFFLWCIYKRVHI
jgi:hypothetical protein